MRQVHPFASRIECVSTRAPSQRPRRRTGAGREEYPATGWPTWHLHCFVAARSTDSEGDRYENYSRDSSRFGVKLWMLMVVLVVMLVASILNLWCARHCCSGQVGAYGWAEEEDGSSSRWRYVPNRPPLMTTGRVML